ncbi:MAG TPA: CRISPR-associated protein [Bacteroidales bacterium]|nr:CRISPR-associated protein [Bacteroidales bacterium]
MLINLSNHPSALWPEKQMRAARQLFGSVTDLPFPQIDPNMPREQMENLVMEYAGRCFDMLKEAGEGPHAVHLMGEMVFTTALVSYLLKRNVRCLASTTRRIAQSQGNMQTSSFVFESFRDYFILS